MFSIFFFFGKVCPIIVIDKITVRAMPNIKTMTQNKKKRNEEKKEKKKHKSKLNCKNHKRKCKIS